MIIHWNTVPKVWWSQAEGLVTDGGKPGAGDSEGMGGDLWCNEFLKVDGCMFVDAFVGEQQNFVVDLQWNREPVFEEWQLYAHVRKLSSGPWS